MELSQKIIGSLIGFAFLFSCESSISTVKPTEVPSTKHTIFSTDFTPMGEFTDGIEGPAIDSKGMLYVVNYQKQGTIGQIDDKGQCSIYLTLPEGSIGNSIQFDEADNMYVADYQGHVIYKISPEFTVDSLVYEPLFNQPNDIALAKNGNVYASDPNWGESTGNLWLIKNGKSFLQEKNMGTTNGVVLSLDEKKLYVNESAQRNVWVYSVNQDGSLTDKTLFHHFKDHGMDGMKIDKNDNLYIARYCAGLIAVISPKGELLDEYPLQGDLPTNLVFSKNQKTIFVTMQKRKGIEKIEL